MSKKVKKTKKGIVREYTEAILVAFIAAMIIRILVIQAFRIPTGSMKDTLLVGDFLLVNKFIYGVRTPERIPFTDIKIPYFRLPAIKEPKRGDIIVFKYPENTKLDYIKRCVALPGQTVEMKDGILYVDGKPEGARKYLKRAYDASEGMSIVYYSIEMENGKKYTIRNYEHLDRSTNDFGPLKVPDDAFFMMGDNRDNSADSRAWGFLQRDKIVGEALIIYWSWDKNAPLYRIFKRVRIDRIGKLIR